MNKSFIKSGLVVIAALALASCATTDEFKYNPDSALQIESVSGISPFAMMQEPASKAVITGDSLPGDEAAKGIGLFVTASGGGAYDGHDSGYTNVKYTFDGSKWSTQSPIYLSSNEGNLYGYFPYNADATDLHAIPVESSLNGTDYLYANPMTVNHSEKNVTLQMNHALSRLHLTIKKGSNFTAGASLSEITLKSTAFDATGTLDLTTGVITASKKSGETGTVELPTDGTITAEGIEKDILLVPADNSEGKKNIVISLMIDGKPAGITLSGANGLDIRSGIQNNVTLTIEDTGIKVTGVGVGTWGDGGSQQVQVDGHTVTVKLSDDAGIADDLIVQVVSDGSSVIVKAYSDSGKPLVIRNDDTTLLCPVEDGNKSTFTFSDVTEDITSTLSYARTVTVSATFIADIMPNMDGYTLNFAEGEEMFFEGREHKDKVTIKVKEVAGYRLDSLVCGEMKVYSNSIELKNITTDTEVKAYFSFIDCLKGEFSVSACKKVHFSRGNLWCDGTGEGYSDETPIIKSWGFESKQYESTPSNNESRTINHISHFMWFSSATESVKLKYPTDKISNIFTNKDTNTPSSDFAINGQKGFWRTLSGGDGGEWQYLINFNNECGATVRSGKYKCGVNVCGHANCLILLPDDWKWGENGVGSVWQDIYSDETSVTWSTMEAAGAVCLPAAGWRKGSGTGNDQHIVYAAGSNGNYWSASPTKDKEIYCLNIFSDRIITDEASQYQAYSVRLVTDVK